jgi:hypothetical protein
VVGGLTNNKLEKDVKWRAPFLIHVQLLPWGTTASHKTFAHDIRGPDRDYNQTYRVIQEEVLVFGQVILLVFFKKKEKKTHLKMCLILNGYRDRAV